MIAHFYISRIAHDLSQFLFSLRTSMLSNDEKSDITFINDKIIENETKTMHLHTKSEGEKSSLISNEPFFLHLLTLHIRIALNCHYHS